MGWFFDGPEDKFKRASAAVNEWWDSIANTAEPLGTVKVHELKATVILCPSPSAMRIEYKARHDSDIPKECSGMMWSDGKCTEIYALYKTTKAGNIVVNEWALGHEIAHCLPIADPDGVDKAEFYES